jgi:predicted flap endonuclease-1-like 5' DNA nuclease
MNRTAPIWMGIAAIAGLVFVVAFGVAYVLYDFGLNGATFVAVIVAAGAGVVLAIGWREPRRDRVAAADIGLSNDKATIPSAESAPATPAAAAVRDAAPGEEAVALREAVAEEEGMQQIEIDAEVTPTEPAPAAPVTPSAGQKPAMLAAPRTGGADDLQQLKGVGAKLETALNGLGIYHLDQIAAWGPAEVLWVDENLQGFKGRASRDGWVAQAKALTGSTL